MVKCLLMEMIYKINKESDIIVRSNTHWLAIMHLNLIKSQIRVDKV